MASSKTMNVIVASDAGGVGKTLFAALLSLALPGAAPVTFEIGSGEGSSKLRRILGRDVSDIVADPVGHDASQALKALGDRLTSGRTVVDLGTRRCAAVADWVRRAAPGTLLREDGVPCLVVVPVVAVSESARAARAAVEGLSGEGRLGGIRPFLVLNEVRGDFEDMDADPDLLWLEAECRSGRMRFARVPRCVGLLGLVDSGRISLGDAVALTPARLAEVAEVSTARAAWWLRSFSAFVLDVLQPFAEARLLPVPLWALEFATRAASSWEAQSAAVKAALVDRVVPALAGATSEVDLMRGVSRDDAALLVEAFPDLMGRVAAEVRAAAMRGEPVDVAAVRTGLLLAAQSQARRTTAGGAARLGRFRRDVVLDAVRQGIEPDDYRVAVSSYVADQEELGWPGRLRALRFIARAQAENLMIRLGSKRRPTWPPGMERPGDLTESS